MRYTCVGCLSSLFFLELLPFVLGEVPSRRACVWVYVSLDPTLFPSLSSIFICLVLHASRFLLISSFLCPGPEPKSSSDCRQSQSGGCERCKTTTHFLPLSFLFQPCFPFIHPLSIFLAVKGRGFFFFIHTLSSTRASINQPLLPPSLPPFSLPSLPRLPQQLFVLLVVTLINACIH